MSTVEQHSTNEWEKAELYHTAWRNLWEVLNENRKVRTKANDPILATSQAAALPWNAYQSLLHRELQDKEITQKTA